VNCSRQCRRRRAVPPSKHDKSPPVRYSLIVSVSVQCSPTHLCTVSFMKNTCYTPLLLAVALGVIPALAHATALSDLTPATAAHTIDNGNNSQDWAWNSLGNSAGTIPYAMQFRSNSASLKDGTSLVTMVQAGVGTKSGSFTSYGLQVYNEHQETSGASSTNYGIWSQATTGNVNNFAVYGYVQGQKTGDVGVWGDAQAGLGSATNYGVLGTSSGATSYAGYFNNTGGGYAAAFMGGNVGIGTATPVNLLDIGTSGGIHIASGVPVGTSMALYNNSGTLTWNGITLATGSSVSGTTNYIPVFTGASSLGNSAVYQSGSNIGIGTATPQSLVHAYGGEVQVGSSGASCAASKNGAIRFSGSSLSYCTGTTWTAVGNGAAPAFSAYLSSNQSVTDSVPTKAQLGTELFDTNGNYDNTTNYRFTPTVAGYYQVNFVGVGLGTSNIAYLGVYIYKNGSPYVVNNFIPSSTSFSSAMVSAIIPMNGSTDYLEFYVQVNGGTSPSIEGGQVNTQASAAMVRGM
jgi:hypothetical protein